MKTITLSLALILAAQIATASAAPVDCQAQVTWEDNSRVCQFGSAYWSQDAETQAWSVIDNPTVYLRVGVPVHGGR